jgi:hypothetical protein
MYSRGRKLLTADRVNIQILKIFFSKSGRLVIRSRPLSAPPSPGFMSPGLAEADVEDPGDPVNAEEQIPVITVSSRVPSVIKGCTQ